MEFPKVYQAARKFKGAEWALCDALVAEIPTGRKMDEAFRRCSRELATHGIDLTAEYLRRLRQVGTKFVAASRHEVSPVIAQEAGTPAILAKATKVAEEEGVPVTKRLVRQVRTAAHRPTKHLPQQARRAVAEAQPVSEVRRQANIGNLERLALNATKAGRDFVGGLAGLDLDEDSRAVLAEDIEDILMVWKAAKQALAGRSIGDEVEAFLAEL